MVHPPAAVRHHPVRPADPRPGSGRRAGRRGLPRTRSVWSSRSSSADRAQLSAPAPDLSATPRRARPVSRSILAGQERLDSSRFENRIRSPRPELINLDLSGSGGQTEDYAGSTWWSSWTFHRRRGHGRPRCVACCEALAFPLTSSSSPQASGTPTRLTLSLSLTQPRQQERCSLAPPKTSFAK